MTTTNEFGQPVGDTVDWAGAREPVPDTRLEGRFVRLEPLTTAHAPTILALGNLPELWTYLPVEPPADPSAAEALCASPPGSVSFAIVVSGSVLGMVSYLRIQPDLGSIEVGGILYAPELQRTRAATEVQYLLARHAFELGYRRYEWKCDALNAPSRRAALRLGFREEGTWRHAMVVKGRNRDTTWFAVTADDWPAVRSGLEAWLDDANHTPDGRQLRSLSDVRATGECPPY